MNFHEFISAFILFYFRFTIWKGEREILCITRDDEQDDLFELVQDDTWLD